MEITAESAERKQNPRGAVDQTNTNQSNDLFSIDSLFEFSLNSFQFTFIVETSFPAAKPPSLPLLSYSPILHVVETFPRVARPFSITVKPTINPTKNTTKHRRTGSPSWQQKGESRLAASCISSSLRTVRIAFTRISRQPGCATSRKAAIRVNIRELNARR